MAITANVELSNGVTISSCYIIVPTVYVKKFSNDGSFKLIYDAIIYKDVLQREAGVAIHCVEVDHFKTDYDVGETDNPFVLAYTHLKTNSKLSSIADA